MSCRKEKFTPGPWVHYAVGPSSDPGWHVVTTANRLRVLANVHIEPGNAMDEANAHLIAAAPELYYDGIRVAKAAERVRFQLDTLLADLNRYPHLKAYGTSVAQAMNELGEELTAAHATRAKARGEA